MARSTMKKKVLAAAALAALVAAVYAPRLPRAFVHWDDDFLIVQNARLTLAPRDLAWMFGTFPARTYQPLGWLFYAALNAAFGVDATACHAALLALHALNAGLFVALLMALGCAPVAAWLAAAAWALHPLMVESAAWATEIPDVLATAFYLGSLLCYVAHARRPRERVFLRAALALFAASCLSRWKGVNLPVVLLLLDAYPIRRAYAWREKLPFFAVASASAAVNALAKAGLPSMDLLGPVRHPLAAAAAVMFYAGKLLVPAGLTPFYVVNAPGEPVALAALAAAAVTAGLFFLRRRIPAAFGAWLCYLTAILPACYASARGQVFAMDHYAYLSTLPLFYPLALALGRLKPKTAVLAAAPALALLAWLSFAQLSVWGGSRALWTHALKVDPSSCPALSNLGQELYDEGDRAAAFRFFERERAACPDNEVTRHHVELLERAR